MGLLGGFARVSVERRDKKAHCWVSVGAVGGSVDADWSLFISPQGVTGLNLIG